MSATAEKPTTITDGALLVQALAKSGTPDHRLVTARAVLRAAWGEEPRRRATAEEVFAAMAEDTRTSPGTLTKARSLIETGRPPAVLKLDDTRIEDAILAPQKAAK